SGHPAFDIAGICASAGTRFSTLTSAWPVLDTAVYESFTLEMDVIFYQVLVGNGATLNDNFDIGIYDLSGKKVFSSGSTAQAGASGAQAVDITDVLVPAGQYDAAMSTHSSTATYRCTAIATRLARVGGCRQQATAFALPATQTPVTFTLATFVPWIGFSIRPVV